MAAQSNVKVHRYHDNLERFIHFYNVDRSKDLVLIQTGCQGTCHSLQVRPRVRDHYLLHFVQSGSGCLQLQNASYQIEESGCFLIYPNELSSYRSLPDSTWSYYWIGIAGESVGELLERIGFAPGKQAMQFTNPAVFRILLQIVDSSIPYKDDIYALELTANGLLYQLFSLLYQENKEKRLTFRPPAKEDNSSLFGIGSSSQHWISAVITLIQDNYGEDLRVDNIADYLHLNRSYLSTLFRQQTGFSIKQYLSAYRIEAAKNKLLKTTDSISDISYQCGFTDPLYFSRIFHEKVGCSPSEFRLNDTDDSGTHRPRQNIINETEIPLPTQVGDFFVTY